MLAGGQIDFAVVLGGDGTLLHFATLFDGHGAVPPVVCIAEGSLGCSSRPPSSRPQLGPSPGKVPHSHVLPGFLTPVLWENKYEVPSALQTLPLVVGE